MDQLKLAKQFEYLRYIRGLNTKDLRRLHNKIFKGTKLAVRLPKWIGRERIEKRIFYYYVLKNYHYSTGSPMYEAFSSKAAETLSRDFIHSKSIEKETVAKLSKGNLFTIDSIRRMSIEEVDRYLAALGFYAEATEDERRYILFEWYNRPASDLIEHYNTKNSKVRAYRKGTTGNKYSLRDLILAHPTLDYAAFVQQFGSTMPTVTRNSFNVQRCILRKAGYDLPKLDKASNAAVKRNEHGRVVRNRY